MDFWSLRAILVGRAAQAGVETGLQVLVSVLVNAAAMLILCVAHHHRLCNVALLALATDVEREGRRGGRSCQDFTWLADEWHNEKKRVQNFDGL